MMTIERLLAEIHMSDTYAPGIPEAWSEWIREDD